MPQTPTRSTKAKKLTNLDMDEISGVDHPAHLTEGWLVMKSTSDSNELPDEIIDLLEDLQKDEGGKMPDNKKGSGGSGSGEKKEPRTLEEATARIEELEREAAKYQRPDPDISTSNEAREPRGASSRKGGDDTDKATQEAQAEAERQELSDAKARIQELEAALEVAQEGGGDEDVEKALILKSLPPQIRQFVLETDAKAQAALEEVEKAREKEADRIYIEKARGWNRLPLSPNEVGPMLRRLNDESPQLAREVERALASVDETARLSGVTKEIGGAAMLDDESPTARLNSLANELVQKSSDGLSFAEAFDQVVQTPAGKKLYDEHKESRRREISAGGAY